jgi:predicted Zn-dependent protease
LAAGILLHGGHSGAQCTTQEVLSQGVMYGFLLPYKRSQETEADVIGLEYMARAEFDPREPVPLWQNMNVESGETPAGFNPSIHL